MTYQLWIGILSIAGSVAGGYIGVKVAVARLEERTLAQDNLIRHLMDRVERLEGFQFSK